MKILYISGASGADYLCDMIFHGLRSLFGPDCVDVNKIHFMYEGTPYPPFFTVYGNLPEIEVDREDITRKIQIRHFDLIVYGSIQRCQTWLPEVTSAYHPSRIVFLDGEDDNIILGPMRGRGLYFKRELTYPDQDLLPIQFCIPKEKILDSIPMKQRLMSALDPHDRSTYVYYGSEEIYYRQYSESYFGRTMKKGGWDCARHYEIIAAGCLPYFEGLEHCPSRTLGFLPKVELLQARQMHDNWVEPNWDRWCDLMMKVRNVLKAHLTTEAMAKYLIERVT